MTGKWGFRKNIIAQSIIQNNKEAGYSLVAIGPKKGDLGWRSQRFLKLIEVKAGSVEAVKQIIDRILKGA